MNVLIIGGGISGVSAAKVALKGQHNVVILEQALEPGGLMAKIANCRVGFKTFYDEIRNDPRLTVINNVKIIAVEKQDGIFKVKLASGNLINADRVIVATGLSPFDPSEIKGKRILTSLEYDALIDQRNEELPAQFGKVAFVLCVGSRSQEYPLCSSVCCSYTLREIKWTLQRVPTEITVFYNDLRFFGLEYYMEKIYRDMGVKFIRSNSRYLEENETGVTVRYFDNGESQEERFDYVVLAIGLRPNPEIIELSRLFGFTLNSHGFINEIDSLKTDSYWIYASGGALEPMNIKDSILTGFGAAWRCLKDNNGPLNPGSEEKLYSETSAEIADIDDPACSSYLFYLGTDDIFLKMFYEYLSVKFICLARELRRKEKDVYIVTKNMVAPSYDELLYEEARRAGVIFVHLEEGESIQSDGKKISIMGGRRDLVFSVDKLISFDDYRQFFQDRDFLIKYRSEPQLRWSPTKWGRKRYHYGFIRYPRSPRWEMREFYGALGEIYLESEQERILPEINEERCSGCGSCKDSCPHNAIEIKFEEKSIAVFGPNNSTRVPTAHVKDDTCVSCGLCASVCPSDVISFP